MGFGASLNGQLLSMTGVILPASMSSSVPWRLPRTYAGINKLAIDFW
jgi:hypothetical protein